MASENTLNKLIKDKYLKVKELIKNKDSVANPYKSKNEARILLIEIKDILGENVCNDNETEIKKNARLAGVNYLLGSISMTMGESSSAEEYLLKSYDLVEDKATHPYSILCAVACLNQIGLLYARFYKNEDALNYLQKSVKIYESYNNNSANEEPVSFTTMYANLLPTAEKMGKTVLEKTHTLTLYYLAQVYTALEDKVKGAMYCHETLKRQIESNDYDHIVWALNAATMSQVLIKKNAFKAARHNLAAATYILDQYEKKINHDEPCKDSESLEATREVLTSRRCDILRCWTKYCLMLLTFSKERLLADEEKNECEPPPKELKDLYFPSLKNSLNEKLVSCNNLLTYDDARPVFLFGQQCCNEATKYYTLTEHASDYSSIAIDHNQLYQGLSFFEEDEDRQSKMLKRRLDILSSVIKNLNPEYYLDICQELWMILGQICIDMVELKIKKIRLTGNDSAFRKNKVNSLIEEGVGYFTSFINSFIDKRTNQMPKDYPKEQEKTIISANLYAARLYMRFMPIDRNISMEIDKKCLKYYEVIVEYAKTHEHIAKDMPGELQVATDMVLLIPYKLTRWTQSDQTNLYHN